MGILSGSGRQQPGNTFAERAKDPSLRTPGRTLHCIGNACNRYEELPPYTANIVQENIEQLPEKKVTIQKKLYDYRGGAAIIAAPGDILPKIYGTTIIQGRVIWAGDIYLDNKGSPRIDIAYGLAEGPIDAMLKVYGGNDKKLLYDANSIDGAINSNKYWRKIDFFTGAIDQDKSKLIGRLEGKSNVPNYRGLSYVIFRGLKLFKFNKTAPDLWFVIGAQYDQTAPEDEYDPTYYQETLTQSVKSIIGYDNKIFFIRNNGAGYLDLTDNSVNSIDSIGAQVPYNQGLAILSIDGVEHLYGCSNSGFYEYNGDGTWTQLVAGVDFRTIVSNYDRTILLTGNVSGSNEIRTYDGATWSGYGNIKGGTGVNPRYLQYEDRYYSKPIFAIANSIADYSYYNYNPDFCPDPPNYGWCPGYNYEGNLSTFHYIDGDVFLSKASGNPDLFIYHGTTPYTKVLSAIGSPIQCYCSEQFQGKAHFGVVNTGVDGGHVYYLDLDLEEIVKVDRPTILQGDNTISLHCMCRYTYNGSTNLYVGSSKGIWKV